VKGNWELSGRIAAKTKMTGNASHMIMRNHRWIGREKMILLEFKGNDRELASISSLKNKDAIIRGVRTVSVALRAMMEKISRSAYINYMRNNPAHSWIHYLPKNPQGVIPDQNPYEIKGSLKGLSGKMFFKRI
jgi:hypothetical protein